MKLRNFRLRLSRVVTGIQRRAPGCAGTRGDRILVAHWDRLRFWTEPPPRRCSRWGPTVETTGPAPSRNQTPQVRTALLPQSRGPGTRFAACVPAAAKTNRLVVHSHAGRYELPEPLVFDPQDSGTAESPTVYAAAPGDDGRVELSGGRAVMVWKSARGPRGEWVADVSGAQRRLAVPTPLDRRPVARPPDVSLTERLQPSRWQGSPAPDGNAAYDTPADRFRISPRPDRPPLDATPRRRGRRPPLLARFPPQNRWSRTRSTRGEARSTEPIQIHRRISQPPAVTTSRTFTRPWGRADSMRTSQPVRSITFRVTGECPNARKWSRRDSRAWSNSEELRIRASSSTTSSSEV